VDNNPGDTPGAPDSFLDGAHAARSIAERLGISFSVLDLRESFKLEVIDQFVASYLRGDTPNPCILCNRFIKFGGLVEYAVERGFDSVATGHYARVEYDAPSKRFLLKKGLDGAKDQSYMLYTLSQDQLSRAVFPLGGLTKNQVREIARVQNFPNAEQRESQDICFIPDGDYAGYIEAYTGEPLSGGDMTDDSGAVVGRHAGAARYTIGQRRGLGLANPEPVYVYDKSTAENIVRIGPEHMLFFKSFTVRDVNLIPFQSLPGPMRVSAKTRYRQLEQPSVIEQIASDVIRVEFDSPQRAITKGQSAVFYDGDCVIGGGVISGVD
jgi:tRNA-specific 2-thiouridylase